MTTSHSLKNEAFAVEVDACRGVVTSLRMANDRYDTNYAGNSDNVSDPGFLANPMWLGDVLLRTWTGSAWAVEATARSGDLRRVAFDETRRRIDIRYDGVSGDDDGLRRVGVRTAFYLAENGLHWETELANRTADTLEVGEVAFPFTMNTDYASLFRGPSQLDGEAPRQQAWHENKVMMHLCISGHSSYALLQRPLGDAPLLMMHTVGDTSLEAAYKVDGAEGSQWDLIWEGQYLLAARSWARKQMNLWQLPREQQRSWIHGHSYLVLEPGETKTFRFRFARLDSVAQMRDELVRAGQVATRVCPGMVVPVGQTVQLQLSSQHAPVLSPRDHGIEIHHGKQNAEHHLYAMTFRTRGQKKIRVSYGEGCWTNLLFYALPPLDGLLKEHARHIAEHQLYDNPDDPYGRHHAFLPYDSMLDCLFLDSDEAWQVGGSDEYCLPVAMFLAEKNVHYPDQAEIDVLETFVDDFLFRTLQDPETYEIRRGMYWFEDHPSRERMNWDRETAELTTRSFNYPLAANIYHSMYRIGKHHGLLQRRTARAYLEMSWRTAMKWLGIGKHAKYGAPAGSTLADLLDDLAHEDAAMYGDLLARVEPLADYMETTPYPYGSELFVDQTAHDQVHAIMERFGRREKAHKTLQITKALRAGCQPIWFWYGNEKRGNVTGWYAQTLNSRALLAGFEETGDSEMIAWGPRGPDELHDGDSGQRRVAGLVPLVARSTRVRSAVIGWRSRILRVPPSSQGVRRGG